jgi:hypothetical protein
MSLTSSTHSLPSFREQGNNQEIPFHRQPSYITLSRTLTRLSNSLLPLSSSSNIPQSDLTPDQLVSLRDLLSPLPYQRTKTLHTIEHARTLLLQLEQSAPNIKIQRVKRDVVRDLAEKRQVIRKLRAVIEELGKEAERREKEGIPQGDWDDYEEGETVEELLGLPPLEKEKRPKQDQQTTAPAETNVIQDEGPTPIPPPTTTSHPKPPTPISPTQQAREDLLNLRQRRGAPTTNPSTAKTTSSHTSSSFTTTTTGTGTTPSTSTSDPTTLLRTDRLTQSTLTDSLLTLATQLKTQSLNLSTTLQTTDKTYLDRALAGLDSNVAGLESASKKMGLLKRMSEGEGWWGRIMLYLWIWGLWLVAVGLVFLGPKLRF